MYVCMYVCMYVYVFVYYYIYIYIYIIIRVSVLMTVLSLPMSLQVVRCCEDKPRAFYRFVRLPGPGGALRTHGLLKVGLGFRV